MTPAEIRGTWIPYVDCELRSPKSNETQLSGIVE
jgi:hypothetical protein